MTEFGPVNAEQWLIHFSRATVWPYASTQRKGERVQRRCPRIIPPCSGEHCARTTDNARPFITSTMALVSTHRLEHHLISAHIHQRRQVRLISVRSRAYSTFSSAISSPSSAPLSKSIRRLREGSYPRYPDRKMKPTRTSSLPRS